jgi:hypothetical protein
VVISISRTARLCIAVIALLLAIPAVTIPSNSEEKLRSFHNRTLEVWPRSKKLVRDPAGYFRQAGRWMADRAGPIIEAASLEKRLLIFVLGTPPQPRITLGKDGYVFVNGSSDELIDDLFEGECRASQTEATYQALARSLPKLGEIGPQLGVSVHAIAVPMTSILYADHLPRSVPAKLREACLSELTGESRLSTLDRQPELNFIYPFAEMKALRDTEGFFPKANYHPMGMSLKVLRDVYLRRAGIEATIDESLELRSVASEILSTYGMSVAYPEYVIRNDRIATDAAAGQRIKGALIDLFAADKLEVKVYVNTGHATRTALLLSDSVGIAAAPVFAAGFRRLVWVYKRGIRSAADAGTLLARVRAIEPVDTMILLLNVGSAADLAPLADGLAAGLAH